MPLSGAQSKLTGVSLCRLPTDLRNLLARIDRKGYPAYKDTRGAYQFPAYVLSIDHVQGTPLPLPPN